MEEGKAAERQVGGAAWGGRAQGQGDAHGNLQGEEAEASGPGMLRNLMDNCN